MDPEAEVRKQVNPFYCNICKIWCASALNLQTHFLGFKHKKVEEALKAHGIVKTASGAGDRGKEPAKIPDYGMHLRVCYLADVLWAKGWSEDFISFWSFVTQLETVKTGRWVCNVRLHKSNFALQCKQSQKGIMDRPWKNSLIRVKIRNLHLVRVFNGVVCSMMFIFGKY
ncbi:hypothetical protein ASZ78_000843 [Callipepla squamata]|uniref:U1-type domain-containing protein n=1 Tax=Callipepla squamata TaxID=9009 RepID=A0A226MPP9_CALSU|nr:hypothetical protein ASZ78_000843 [Callipepla squamata]